MDHPAPCADCSICVDQPPVWEHSTVDGVFIKQMYLRQAGTLVPQHAHRWDHTSMLAKGSVRAWADGKFLGTFHAPAPIFIAARVKHTFQSLEPDTLIYCVHRLHGTVDVEVVEEHQFT